MPKFRVPVPKLSEYTNDNLIIGPNMVDGDNMDSGVEAEFRAEACIEDGCSGQKKIDTLYENYSQDIVDKPRSTIPEVAVGRSGVPNHEGTENPAPIPTDLHNYPHRRY
jgi:hypothetical protein